MDKVATLSVGGTDFLTLSGGLNNDLATTPLNTNGDNQVTFTVSGTFTGVSVQPQLQTPSGTWVPVGVVDEQVGAVVAGGVAISVPASTTKAWSVRFPAGLFVDAKLILSALSTGSVTAEIATGKVPPGGVTMLVPVASGGILSGNLESLTISALGTAQNSTPTAAQLAGGVVTQTGATGAGTVTLPTGTQLAAALPGAAAQVGTAFSCTFANLGGGQTLTITGATGSTVIGTAAVPSGKNATLLFVATAATAFNVYVIVSA